MASGRGRSRAQSRRAYDSSRSRSVSPTVVDSGAPSRVASTIDLPREQEYGQTYDARYERSGRDDPYGRAQSHQVSEKQTSLAKLVIVVGLATVAAGAVQLLKSRNAARDAARKNDRRDHKYDDDRRRDKRGHRRREERERNDHEREHDRRARREVEQWQEQINRRQIAYEPYEGSSRGSRRRDEREYDRRSDTRSRNSRHYG